MHHVYWVKCRVCYGCACIARMFYVLWIASLQCAMKLCRRWHIAFETSGFKFGIRHQIFWQDDTYNYAHCLFLPHPFQVTHWSSCHLTLCDTSNLNDGKHRQSTALTLIRATPSCNVTSPSWTLWTLAVSKLYMCVRSSQRMLLVRYKDPVNADFINNRHSLREF